MNKSEFILEQLSNKAESLPQAEFSLDYYIFPEREKHSQVKFYDRPKSIVKCVTAMMASVCLLAASISWGTNANFHQKLTAFFAPDTASQSQSGVDESESSAINNKFTPNMVTEIASGVKREDYADFYNEYHSQGMYVTGVHGNIICTSDSKDESEETKKQYYQYTNGEIVPVSFENVITQFEYNGENIRLNYDYILSDEGLVLFDNSESNADEYTVTMTNSPDVVLIYVQETSAVLYNIAQNTALDVFITSENQSVVISPDGSKIRFVGGEDTITNYYLDLNSMEIKEMGFKQTHLEIDGLIYNRESFISWIDDENVLYYNQEWDTTLKTDLMRINVTTGEKTVVKENSYTDINYCGHGQFWLIRDSETNNFTGLLNVMTGAVQSIPEFDTSTGGFFVNADGKWLSFKNITYESGDSSIWYPQTGVVNLGTREITMLDEGQTEYEAFDACRWLSDDAYCMAVNCTEDSSDNTGYFYVYKFE